MSAPYSLAGRRDDGSSIWRPGGSGVTGTFKSAEIGKSKRPGTFFGGEHLLVAAVDIGSKQVRFAFGRIPSNEGDPLSIGRESDGSIDVLNQQTRSRSKGRHLVEVCQIESVLVAAHKVDVVAVWRERQSIEDHRVRRQDLHGALGSDLTHPQALFFPFPQHINNIA